MEEEIKCYCGGILKIMPSPTIQEFIIKLIGPPPNRKLTRKKRKLLKKKYYRKYAKYALAAKLVTPIMPIYFECNSCGAPQSVYKAMARNMIKVEPLPEPQFVLDYK